MTSLAVWAKESGYSVSGSDVQENFPNDAVLAKAAISFEIGFDPERIQALFEQYKQQLIVIYTGAHNGRDNPEVQTAISLGVETLPHGKALGEITKDKKVIAVAGCHGKTTTTAMIATIFTEAGLHPSYCIGSGEIRGLGLPGHAGTGEWFIVEADEYVTDPHHDLTPRFLWLHPELLVITSIDYDHPDVYSSLDDVAQAYLKLVSQITATGCLFWNNQDLHSQTYLPQQGIQFEIDPTIQLTVPGKHNLSNASAAYQVARYVGIPDQIIRKGLLAFQGASRRFEIIGTKNSVQYVDDYAHHPQEIQATLQAAKEFHQRVIAVFQPHTYSRTQSLLPEFATAFTNADVVVITGIYPSAREPVMDMKAKDVVAVITHPEVYAEESKADLFARLDKIIKQGDTVLFMGAGDIGSWGREYYETQNHTIS
jgi:UDP-N-acetylmuramate--alanine ligase